MPTSNPLPPSRKNQLNQYARFSAMGLQMGGIIFLFVWGGHKLDQHLKLQFPVFTLTGSVLGIGSAIYFVIHNLNNIKKQ